MNKDQDCGQGDSGRRGVDNRVSQWPQFCFLLSLVRVRSEERLEDAPALQLQRPSGMEKGLVRTC